MTVRGLLAASLLLASLGGRAAFASPGAPDARPVRDTVTDPDRYLEVLVELRFGRVLARTIEAFQIDEVALLPLADFFRMADYRFTTEGDTALTVILQPGDVPARFAVGGTGVTVGDRVVALGPENLIRRNGVLYVATTPLGQVLGVSFLVDWQGLYVAIEDPSPLPVIQSIQRAARRRALSRSRTPWTPAQRLTASRTGFDGFVVNYAALLPSTDPIANGSFSLGLGANLLGGSLEVTTRTTGGPNRTADLRGSWTGFWPDDPMLKQVRVGDATATGPRPRAIRGLSITNVPFFRPPDFGVADYRGQLPPGWEVEAYRNGALVGYDSVAVDGGFAFNLPVQRGQNAVDFVAYGPYGEVRRFNQTFQIGQTILPHRQFEYGVSAGSCSTAACAGAFNADMRYGLTRRITVQGGYDRFWRNGTSDLDHPYVAIGGSVINALTLELGAVYQGFTRAALRVEPSINARFLVERFDYTDGVTDPIIAPPETRSRTAVNLFYRPVQWNRYLFLEAQADRFDQVQGRTSRGRLAVSAALDNFTVSPFVRLVREDRNGLTDTRTFGGLQVVALPHRRLGQVLGSLTFRAGIQAEDLSRVTQADVSIFRSFRQGFRIEAGAAWTEAIEGTSYRLGITSTVGGVFAGLRSLIAGDGRTESFAQLQGSAVWNPQRRAFTLSPVGTFQQSGITGTVFLDENANGVRDPGEPPVPGARVIIGYNVVRADEQGRYQALEASPFEAAVVAVDSLSLENPLWVPLYQSISVAPGPNAFMTVHLPVVESGVIEGRVVSADGVVRTGFIPLQLVNRQTGDVTSLTTFSDGEFYQMGIRPGTYELRVDEARLSGVEAVGRVVRFTVSPQPGGTTVADLELHIQAAPSP